MILYNFITYKIKNKKVCLKRASLNEFILGLAKRWELGALSFELKRAFNNTVHEAHIVC